MSLFCIRSKKKSEVYDWLSTYDNRSKATLVIHTCYLDNDIKGLKEFVSYVRQRCNRLEKIELYIDSKELNKHYYELVRWNSALRGIEREIYAVRCDKIFHSKAYAIINFDENGSVRKGGLVVGSGNLTGNGLVNPSGNIESFLGTDDVDEIQDFYQRTKQLNPIPISKWQKTERNLPGIVVNLGTFIHLWTDNDHTKQYLTLKFNLTEKGKQQIREVQNLLQERGYDIDSNTISHNYFNWIDSAVSIKGWKKNYMIESLLGYWMPKVVFNKMVVDACDKGFVSFKNRLLANLEEQLKTHKEEMDDAYKMFRKSKIIKKETCLPSKKIENKIEELKKDEDLLKRYYYKYEEFDFPYDCSKPKEYDEMIKKVFKSLKFSADISRSKSVIKKAFYAFIDGDRDAFNKVIVKRSF